MATQLKHSGKFHGKSNALGGGGRFAQLEAKAKASGASNPGAVAAAIGRKKYGNKKFTKMAVAGKKRAAKKENLTHKLGKAMAKVKY